MRGLWGPGPGLPQPALPSHQRLASCREVLGLGRASGSTWAGAWGAQGAGRNAQGLELEGRALQAAERWDTTPSGARGASLPPRFHPHATE